MPKLACLHVCMHVQAFTNFSCRRVLVNKDIQEVSPGSRRRERGSEMGLKTTCAVPATFCNLASSRHVRNLSETDDTVSVTRGIVSRHGVLLYWIYLNHNGEPTELIIQVAPLHGEPPRDWD